MKTTGHKEIKGARWELIENGYMLEFAPPTENPDKWRQAKNPKTLGIEANYDKLCFDIVDYKA